MSYMTIEHLSTLPKKSYTLPWYITPKLTRSSTPYKKETMNNLKTMTISKHVEYMVY